MGDEVSVLTSLDFSTFSDLIGLFFIFSGFMSFGEAIGREVCRF